MTAWREADAAVGAWVAGYAAEAADDTEPWSCALLAWAQLHGSVGPETAGRCTGMGP